jgi:hypothetical protein
MLAYSSSKATRSASASPVILLQGRPRWTGLLHNLARHQPFGPANGLAFSRRERAAHASIKNSNLAREAVGQERRVGRRRRWQNVWRIATLLPDLGLTFVL